MTHTLNFQFLDDLQSLPASAILDELPHINIDALGPAFEFYFQNKEFLRRNFCILRKSVIVDVLQNAIFASRGRVDSRLEECEIIKIPSSIQGLEYPTWTSFLLRAQQAAEASGIVKKMAQALIGTLEEMAEKVIWHSESIEVGLVGYRWESGWFEYCVGDPGIGVLASLRRNPLYAELGESVEALHLALQNGVSRFNSDDRRGTGFNGLLNNIAKNGCNLRFHSFDGVVEYDGILSLSNNDAIRIKDSSAPILPGFTISLLSKSE